MARVGSFLIAILLLSTSAAWSDADLCEGFVEKSGLTLPYAQLESCDFSPGDQTFLKVIYSVPAEFVLTAQDDLATLYGVPRLRFYCCYYSSNLQDGLASYPLRQPEMFQHMLGPGAILSATIQMTAQADDGTMPFTPQPLGKLDGQILISIAGI